MRFGSRFTVDRHGLRPRDDKVGKECGCAVRFQHNLCHCEERTKQETWQSTACNGRVRAMRFASRLTVDRHGLSALVMTRWWSDEWYGSKTTKQHVIARRTEWTTRQSIVSRGRRTTCLSAYWFTVDRHGLSALAITRLGSEAVDGWRTNRILSLRGKSGARDVAIHCMQ